VVGVTAIRPTLNFTDIAASVLAEAAGDRNAALALGQQEIRTFLEHNPERAIETVMPILSNKLWDALRELTEPKRTHQSSGPPGQRTADQDRLGLSILGRDYAYNFLLPGGMKLGNAQRDDIERARTQFAATTREASQHAIWMNQILKEMKNGKTVSETFSEDRLLKMFKGAKASADELLGGKTGAAKQLGAGN
jgi:hypothetical protein